MPQGGYMGKLLFVDLTNHRFAEEELSEATARRFVGGYGVGARVMMARMRPGVEPIPVSEYKGGGKPWGYSASAAGGSST